MPQQEPCDHPPVGSQVSSKCPEVSRARCKCPAWDTLGQVGKVPQTLKLSLQKGWGCTAGLWEAPGGYGRGVRAGLGALRADEQCVPSVPGQLVPPVIGPSPPPVSPSPWHAPVPSPHPGRRQTFCCWWQWAVQAGAGTPAGPIPRCGGAGTKQPAGDQEAARSRRQRQPRRAEQLFHATLQHHAATPRSGFPSHRREDDGYAAEHHQVLRPWRQRLHRRLQKVIGRLHVFGREAGRQQVGSRRAAGVARGQRGQQVGSRAVQERRRPQLRSVARPQTPCGPRACGRI